MWQESSPDSAGKLGRRIWSKGDTVKLFWGLVQVKFDLPLDLRDGFRGDARCHFRNLSLLPRFRPHIRSAGLQSIVICFDPNRGRKRSCDRKPTPDDRIFKEQFEAIFK